MIIIDQPYISEDFIKTLKKNNFPVIATPEGKQTVPDESLNWISEEEAIHTIKNNPDALLYTTSENSIGWVEKNLANTRFPGQLQIFKNKIKFRELLRDVYPDYFFKAVKYADLRSLDITEIKLPFIVKPAVGFFSIGVHKIDAAKDWPVALDRIDEQLKEVQGLYPKEVVDIEDFIIEENIEGEEYAIDCYFDEAGKPVVMMILHHVFSSSNDVGDRVYSTSADIIKQNLAGVEEFLQIIGKKHALKSFPAHIEVRIDENGLIQPIEVNPLRFGGWCTTADLTTYAFGFNAYEYFLHGKKPDWQEITSRGNDNKYSIIILDNSTGIADNKIASFDYDQLLTAFENPVSLRKIDYRKYSVFGFLFTETSPGNKELDRILTCDLKKYVSV